MDESKQALLRRLVQNRQGTHLAAKVGGTGKKSTLAPNASSPERRLKFCQVCGWRWPYAIGIYKCPNCENIREEQG